jgi:hypothetical protein
MLKISPKREKALRGRSPAEVTVRGEGGLKTIIPASRCVAKVFLKTL